MAQRTPIKKTDLIAKAEAYLSELNKFHDDARSVAILTRERNLKLVETALRDASDNIMDLYAGDDDDVEYSDFDERTPLSISHYEAHRNRPGYVIVKLVVPEVQFPPLPDYTDDIADVQRDIERLKATTKEEVSVGEDDRWFRYFGHPSERKRRR
jgi:hypothetical protein